MAAFLRNEWSPVKSPGSYRIGGWQMLDKTWALTLHETTTPTEQQTGVRAGGTPEAPSSPFPAPLPFCNFFSPCSFYPAFIINTIEKDMGGQAFFTAQGAVSISSGDQLLIRDPSLPSGRSRQPEAKGEMHNSLQRTEDRDGWLNSKDL